MSVLTWLLAGGVTGWLACVYLGTRHSQAFVFNISVATIGAAIGSWALGPTFGVEPGFGVYGVLFGMVCGALCVAVAQIVQRRIMN